MDERRAETGPVGHQRRNTETYMQEQWRSESPQRYTYHSNFRRGTDSERNSPSRHSSVSPDRYRLTQICCGTPERELPLQGSGQVSCLISWLISAPISWSFSAYIRQVQSFSQKGVCCLPDWLTSRATPSHRRTDSLHLQNGDYDAQRGCSRETRSPSQASNKHSLDSEKLYRDLEFISRVAPQTISNTHMKVLKCLHEPEQLSTALLTLTVATAGKYRLQEWL
ncbi:hypothetical protein INR49_006537 [Caranx melampygus]|nr:hypothetical protein INR49_006537 [Caranx melampygus]